MRRKKIVKKGFQLCLMVCGRSGTGKSTFINTLCEGQVYPEVGDVPQTSSEMDIRTHHVDLCEPDGTTIGLTVVDTPGFGDAINNSDCCNRILSYVERQFDEILAEETRVRRNPRFCDNRIHVALYFIASTGRGLREIDIDFMIALSRRVNIIPVIAKADTMTSDELVRAKSAIMADIQHFHIPIYYFPYDTSGSVDDETVEECQALRDLVPFAIVGSNATFPDPSGSGVAVRGRKYPWGFVRVEDPEHSDFAALRSVLFGSHLQELRDLTHDVIYEKYRTEKLSDNPDDNGDEGCEEDNGYANSVSARSRNSLRREHQRLREIEASFQREIEQKRQELMLRESQLQEIESQLGFANNTTTASESVTVE